MRHVLDIRILGPCHKARLQNKRSLKPPLTAKANPNPSEITTFLELSTFKFTTGSLDRSAGRPEIRVHSTWGLQIPRSASLVLVFVGLDLWRASMTLLAGTVVKLIPFQGICISCPLIFTCSERGRLKSTP